MPASLTSSLIKNPIHDPGGLKRRFGDLKLSLMSQK
jgi:hypothetical protein